MNVVDSPIDTFPLTVIFENAVNDTDVPVPTVLVRFPTMVNAVAGKVLIAEPPELLNFRLP